MNNKHFVGKILMFLLVVSVLFLVLLLVFRAQKASPTMTEKLKNETPTPTIGVSRPLSRWATDSGILEIEENLKNLSEEVKSVDLKESGLLPPLLDMEIKF